MVKTRPGGRGPALYQRRAAAARLDYKIIHAETAEHAGTGA